MASLPAAPEVDLDLISLLNADWSDAAHSTYVAPPQRSADSFLRSLYEEDVATKSSRGLHTSTQQRRPAANNDLEAVVLEQRRRIKALKRELKAKDMEIQRLKMQPVEPSNVRASRPGPNELRAELDALKVRYERTRDSNTELRRYARWGHCPDLINGAS
ncbi:hypothetical protein SDRG_05499 [Saprolegnia diclina VS20]|uniref:Uncharacterized protein n=1 Tax=Saprolegnia diclina (strain VS20) TaxID=1156394 RepID=T0QTD2_SAPDV|nr:hypothetical protein SDRG_05499 [Saprolegnia diclina VS20]EQC37275.1 hypothetical protein SDRG_05499 [Saprolegnia diclina VS20]|eukprot:XP_008609437.1 hypothetical protein SDRG_05499 [Saprolegnia diclina VS20]